jgi:hypothetical protein
MFKEQGERESLVGWFKAHIQGIAACTPFRKVKTRGDHLEYPLDVVGGRNGRSPLSSAWNTGKSYACRHDDRMDLVESNSESSRLAADDLPGEHDLEFILLGMPPL